MLTRRNVFQELPHTKKWVCNQLVIEPTLSELNRLHHQRHTRKWVDEKLSKSAQIANHAILKAMRN